MLDVFHESTCADGKGSINRSFLTRVGRHVLLRARVLGEEAVEVPRGVPHLTLGSREAKMNVPPEKHIASTSVA